MELLALTRENIEGVLVVVSAFVIFGGSVLLLLGAVFGLRMAYLVVATGFFAFMIILSALWSFGAELFGVGTPPFLGPKGEIPTWIALGAGRDLTSPTFPVLDRYPDDPWKSAEEDPSRTAEVESVSLAVQEFLAEEAQAALVRARIEGEVAPEDFQVTDLEFTTVDGTPLATARAFASGGGPEVEVFAYKDPGNEALPSYLFLAASVIGFVAHLPLLDRAERKRKDILTGGQQSPWRGPA
jgi:hypothetical protein